MLVHMGWMGDLPERKVRLVDAAREFLGTSLMFHTDESIIPERWRVSVSPRMRSDLLRHAVLKEYGGLWLDVDVRLVKHPEEWTAAWDRYTAVFLTDRAAVVGTDIIFCPLGWDGWDLIDEYLTAFAASGGEGAKTLSLAHRMILECQAQRPEAFSTLLPGSIFPYDRRNFSSASVVARGYSPPSAPPSLMQKAKNFATSAAKHIASGMPRCTQEQIDARFAICQGCEFLKDNACTKCGCPINREKRFISKLSWANEKCPIGKWGPVDNGS